MFRAAVRGLSSSQPLPFNTCMGETLLFVYGTLRRGSGHRMQAVLARDADFVAAAWTQGQLYLVARYPGLVASETPTDRVLGDVYRLRVPTVLEQLDRYEACDPRDPNAPYVRSLRTVSLVEGDAVTAWVYLYQRPTDALERIPSGDFFAARGDSGHARTGKARS